MILGLAAEGPSDAFIVPALGDRVLCHTFDWYTPEGIGDLRTWRGVDGTNWLDVHRAYDEARRKGLRVHGHFSDEPGLEDARQTRAILALFNDEDAPPEVLVISRDMDGRAERRKGFLQALEDAKVPFRVVLAGPQPESEAWLLAAFEPRTERERDALAEERKNLGFDPTREAHKLKHGRDDAKRNCKRVLDALTDAPHDHLEAAPLDRLHTNGAGSGLATFLAEFTAAIQPGRRP